MRKVVVQDKPKKSRNFARKIVYILIGIVLTFGCVCGAVGLALRAYAHNSVSYAENAEPIEVASETKTMYYLEIPLQTSGIYGYARVLPETNNNRFYTVKRELESYSSNQTPVPFIFTFNKICPDGISPLMATWKTKVTIVTSSTKNPNTFFDDLDRGGMMSFPYIKFNENIKINIRKEYYEYLTNGDFSDFSISYMYNGNAYLLYNSHFDGTFRIDSNEIYHNVSGIKTSHDEVPEDYDPIANEGQIGDNGGVAEKPVEPDKSSGNSFPWWVWFIIYCAANVAFLSVAPKLIVEIFGADE